MLYSLARTGAVAAAVALGASFDLAPSQAAGGVGESISGWFDEASPAETWATDGTTVSGAAPTSDSILDASVEPVQMMMPQFQGPAARQPIRLSGNNPRPAARAAAASSLASVPYMIGDTGAGTCLGFSGLLDVGLAHPTLACGRLNIAEANSPLPTDRIYYSYRHFDAATPLDVYQFSEELDVDRHTLAFERTFWDGMCSIEVRAPIEHRLSSETRSILTDPGIIDLTLGDARTTELGNISMIFKGLLVERDGWAVSGGLGVTLPTAKDVQYDILLNGPVDYGNGLTAQTFLSAFQFDFSNETVYLLPFLAWVYAPESRWFHQGFLQVEVAANPSRVTAFGGGAYGFFQDGVFFDAYGYGTGPEPVPPLNPGDPIPPPIPVRADLQAQTLLRTNLGWGYKFWESAERDRYGRGAANRLTGLFEVHYTSTLDDANLSDIPTVDNSLFGTTPENLQTIQVGNVNNRVDILNFATGASIQLSDTLFTAGVVVPVRDCPDCGFDIEYNAQVQRRF